MKYWLHYRAKALYSSVVAFLGALGTAAADNQGISLNEWIAIATATVVAYGAVYFGTNGPVPATAKELEELDRANSNGEYA